MISLDNVSRRGCPGLRHALLACLSGLALTACDKPVADASAQTTLATSVGAAAASAPDAMTRQLRTMWLTLKAGEAGVSPPPGKHAYGAAFEMNFGEGTATVVTLADGSTSMYLSSGGGSIGLGEHAAVRAASAHFLAVIDDSLPGFGSADDHAYPPEGQAHFYALTDRGLLRSAPAPMDDIERDEKHTHRRMYEAAQDLVTQIRLANEQAP